MSYRGTIIDYRSTLIDYFKISEMVGETECNDNRLSSQVNRLSHKKIEITYNLLFIIDYTKLDLK